MLDRSVIRGFELFASMTDADLDAVLADAKARRIPKGEAVFEQGQPARAFYVLLDGRLKVVQVTPEGEQMVVRFVVPGEVYGVAVALRRPDYPGTATAVVDSLTLVWESRHWEELCRRAPMLPMNTLHTVGQRLQEAHIRLREMSTEEVERRVAHALLRLIDQSGRKTADGVLIDFPITRQDIADMTGTTLHTVSRILSAWETEGLVAGGRQRIVVCEPHKLFVLAEGAGRKG